MTKQEKIREGIERLIPTNVMSSSERKHRQYYADRVLDYLRDNDVVIRVDRELPKTPYDSTGELPDKFFTDRTSTDMDVFIMHCNGIEKGKSLMLKAGCGFFESLIKEI